MKLRICTFFRSPGNVQGAWRQAVGRLLLSAALAILSPLLWASAEQEEGSKKPKPVDVVLLFDTSGSMLKTDPLQLRYQGVKQVSNFLGKSDRLAVIGFSDQARIFRPLKRIAPDSLAEFESEMGAIRSEGQYTDILEGIQAAQRLLESDPRAGVERAVVLISDGKMEPTPAKGLPFARTLELVHDVLPILKSKETRVYTLALSEHADRPLLREIAGATDGVSFYAASASELKQVFEQLFEAMVPTTAQPVAIRSFHVEEAAEEASFFVSHSAGAKISLTAPNGDHISPIHKPDHVRWFTGEKFSFVTIPEPESGDWEVEGIEPADSFAALLGNLKLAVDWPVTIRSEEPALMQARLYEGDKPISLPEMSSLVRVGYQVAPTDRISAPILDGSLNDEGRSGDKVAGDGIFSGEVSLKEIGEYRLTISAKSPNFTRAQQVSFRVKPRLLVLEAELGGHAGQHEAEPEAGESEHGSGHQGDEGERGALRGDEHTIFKALVSREVANMRDVSVTLIARSADRKRYEIPLKRSAEDPYVYEVHAGALPKDGRYTLSAELRAQGKNRLGVSGSTPELAFIRKVSPHPAETRATVVVQEQEPAAKEQPLTLVTVGIITLLNVALGIAAYVFLWKKRPVRSTPAPKYIPQRSLLDAIGELEGKVAKSEIALDDPLLEQMRARASSQASETPPEPAKEASP